MTWSVKSQQGNRNAVATVARDPAALAGMRRDRRRGMTFEQIAQKWGVSAITARSHTLRVAVPERGSPSKGRPLLGSINTPARRPLDA